MEPTPDQTGFCPNCGKRPALCICSYASLVESKTKVLIIQHPQEPKEDLGTARLITLTLPNARIKTGLSWRNLSAAWGDEVDNRRWGVLFLGTQQESKQYLLQEKQVIVLNPRGKPLLASEQNPDPEKLDGIVAIDGTWRQAKAIWWRNAWLLKLNRIVLSPRNASLYGKLRREPRRESLSTLEAVALCVSENEGNSQIEAAMLRPFRALLQKFRASRENIKHRPSER